MSTARVIAYCGAFGIAGCSLFVSLDGLSDGAAVGVDADVPDTSSDQFISDAGTVSDADSGDASNIFFDDFNRSDDALLGNGWIEKRSVAFSLSNDAVLRGDADAFNYSDNMVYRPAGEDIGDSQISVELIFPSAVAGYPQIHSRIQQNTITGAGAADAYLLYISDSTTNATISRTRGQTNLTDFASATLSPPLVAGERYRLTLRVSGANPVFLYGMVEHFSAGSWVMIGQVTAADSDSTQQLDDAGSVGFSASAEDPVPYVYDNFMRTPL
jgi:hypothetical protein